MVRSREFTAALTVLTVCLTASLAMPLAAVEPAYDALLIDGIRSYDEGDTADAAKWLQVACFGLLEDPPKLARGLAYLALSLEAIEQRADFLRTANRLLEAEIGFAAYRRADLPPEVRAALEPLLAEHVSLDLLLRVETFAPAARDKLEIQLGLLPASQRRAELPRWIEIDPDEPRWQAVAAAAELDVDPPDPEAALRFLELVFEHDPEHSLGRCQRGRAHAALRTCDETTFADLAHCGRPREDPEMAASYLRCYAALGDRAEAEAVLDALPRETRKEEVFKQLWREIRRGGP